MAPIKGRALISLVFIILGATKLVGFASTVGYMASLGLPAPTALAALVILIEIGGGLALLLGFHARLAAWMLSLFVLGTIIVAHRNLSDPMQLTQALKNLAIIGGLIYVAKYGSGAWSLSRGSGCGCCDDGSCVCDSK
ncbi:DoxX family protein [Candidatus Kaiserbacteria bacterium]|nr:DoxX family protein [Candidatus Kaiserbacteria bacterium]